MKVELDEVRLEDVNRLFDLEKKVFKDDAFPKDLLGKLIRRNLYFLTLRKGSFRKKVVGFIIVVKDRQNRANIINILIAPKFQGRGLGKKLLNETLNKIREMEEIRSVVLNVAVSNEIAISWYRKFNFKKIRKIEEYYRSQSDAYLMELKI